MCYLSYPFSDKYVISTTHFQTWRQNKGKVLWGTRAQVVQTGGVTRSTATPPGWDFSASLGYSQQYVTGIHLYTWVRWDVVEQSLLSEETTWPPNAGGTLKPKVRLKHDPNIRGNPATPHSRINPVWTPVGRQSKESSRTMLSVSGTSLSQGTLLLMHVRGDFSICGTVASSLAGKDVFENNGVSDLWNEKRIKHVWNSWRVH